MSVSPTKLEQDLGLSAGRLNKSKSIMPAFSNFIIAKLSHVLERLRSSFIFPPEEGGPF